MSARTKKLWKCRRDPPLLVWTEMEVPGGGARGGELEGVRKTNT